MTRGTVGAFRLAAAREAPLFWAGFGVFYRTRAMHAPEEAGTRPSSKLMRGIRSLAPLCASFSSARLSIQIH